MKNQFIDIVIPIIFVLVLVVLHFFWDCKWDIYMTILAGIVLVVTILTSYVQNRKMKELEEAQENK